MLIYDRTSSYNYSNYILANIHIKNKEKLLKVAKDIGLYNYSELKIYTQ